MPQLDVYRQQQTARNELRVVQNAQPSESASQVVGETITAIGELGMRIEEGRAKSEAAKLEVEAKRAYDQAYREIEADPDAADQLESRIVERQREIRAGLLKQVKSGAVRQVFDQRLTEIETAYVIEGRNLSRARAVEGIKADMIGLIDGLGKTAADMSVPFEDAKNPNRRSVKNEAQAALALIDGSMRSGFIGKDDAAELKLKVEGQMLAADSNRIVGAIDEALDSGDPLQISAAKEMFKMNYARVLPEQREKVEEVLETKTREAVAVTTADRLWTESGGNYDAFITKTREIANVDERLAVEARGAQLKNQDDAAREAADKALLEKGMGYIVSGRGLPADLLRRASPTVVDRLQSEQRTRQLWAQQMATSSAEQKVAMRELSKGNYYALKAQLVDPEMAAGGINAILADPVLAEMYSTLGPDERGQLENEIATAATPATADKTLKNYKAVAALASAYMPESLTPKDYAKQFGGVGEGDPGVAFISANRAKAPGAMTFEKELMRLVDGETARLGGAEITADRAKQLVAQAYAAAGKQADGSTKYPIAQDVAAGIVTTASSRVAIDYRNSKPTIWREASTLVRSQYPNASDELILEEARRIEQQLEMARAGKGERGRFPME